MKNKTLLALMSLFIVGCSSEQYTGGFRPVDGAYYETVEKTVHHQACFFSEKITISSGNETIIADSAEIISVPFADRYWYAGHEINCVNIVLSDETRYSIDTIKNVVDINRSTDSIITNIYHDNICTVSVDWIFKVEENQK